MPTYQIYATIGICPNIKYMLQLVYAQISNICYNRYMAKYQIYATIAICSKIKYMLQTNTANAIV